MRHINKIKLGIILNQPNKIVDVLHETKTNYIFIHTNQKGLQLLDTEDFYKLILKEVYDSVYKNILIKQPKYKLIGLYNFQQEPEQQITDILDIQGLLNSKNLVKDLCFVFKKESVKRFLGKE